MSIENLQASPHIHVKIPCFASKSKPYRILQKIASVICPFLPVSCSPARSPICGWSLCWDNLKLSCHTPICQALWGDTRSQPPLSGMLPVYSLLLSHRHEDADITPTHPHGFSQNQCCHLIMYSSEQLGCKVVGGHCWLDMCTSEICVSFRMHSFIEEFCFFIFVMLKRFVFGIRFGSLVFVSYICWSGWIQKI